MNEYKAHYSYTKPSYENMFRPACLVDRETISLMINIVKSTKLLKEARHITSHIRTIQNFYTEFHSFQIHYYSSLYLYTHAGTILCFHQISCARLEPLQMLYYYIFGNIESSHICNIHYYVLMC